MTARFNPPLKAALFRAFTGVFTNLVDQVQQHSGTVPPELTEFKGLTKRLSNNLLDAFTGFLDPGSGRLPTGPDGRDIFPPALLETMRKLMSVRDRLLRDKEK